MRHYVSRIINRLHNVGTIQWNHSVDNKDLDWKLASHWTACDIKLTRSNQVLLKLRRNNRIDKILGKIN